MEKLKVGILGLQRGVTHLHNFLAVEEALVIGAADRRESCREHAKPYIGIARRSSSGSSRSCSRCSRRRW